MLSGSAPWKSWMHMHWRPDVLALYPIDFFHRARIRTTAIIGGPGEAESVRIYDLDTTQRGARFRSNTWTRDTNWYSITSPDEGPIPLADVEGASLESFFTIAAGCTTGDAYKLKPLVVDAKHDGGRKLVTTGSIDRFVLKWGTRPTRYLKSDYVYPRWPDNSSEKSIVRAHDRQAAPKLIVAGYTLVIESWCDPDGEAAGVVQTWVVTRPGTPKVHQARLLYALAGVLNSAAFSREFVRRHGSNAMTGDYIVIKKGSLKSMPVPEIFHNPNDILCSDPLVAIAQHEGAWHDRAAHAAVAALLSRLCMAIQTTNPDAVLWQQLDKLGHSLAGALYGRPPVAREKDYHWWCSRTGTSVCEENYPQLLEVAQDFLHIQSPTERK